MKNKNIPVEALIAEEKYPEKDIYCFKIEDNDKTYFGTLKIIVRTCKKSLPEDPPENSAFIQIWNQKFDKREKKIFSGWMFSSSPSISALDHAVYDVWVIDCMISYIED